MEINDEDLKAKILHRLFHRHAWAHKHVDFAHLASGFPRHARGRILGIAKELVRENLIILKPAHYGLQVSLNFKERERILAILLEYSKKERPD